MEIVELVPSKPHKESCVYLVTAIKPAIKTENRVNVFINNKFDFSLEISQVIDLHLKVGSRLTIKELNDCRRASEFGKLYCNTLEYVLIRPRSIKEVRDHLKDRRKKREILKLPLYTDQDIEEIIARLIKKGYLDDEKFAKFFIENRNVKKGISRKKLGMELKKKGVSCDIIEKSLINSERSDAEEIQKIIVKKAKKYDTEKLIAYLVRQGFDYQQSKDAVLEMDSQNSEQNPLW